MIAISTVKMVVLFLLKGLGITASGSKVNSVVISRKSGDRHRFAVADGEAYTGVVANWHDHATAKKVGKGQEKKKVTQQVVTPTPSNVKVNATDKNLLVDLMITSRYYATCTRRRRTHKKRRWLNGVDFSVVWLNSPQH